SLWVLHRCHWDRLGARRHSESVRNLRDRVPVTHPYAICGGKVLQEGSSSTIYAQGRLAVFTLTGRLHLAAEALRHELVSVAQAQHGDAELEQVRIDLGTVGLVDRHGATRKDDLGGTARPDLFRAQIMRDDL